MIKQENVDKQLRISKKSHEAITNLAQKEGLSIKEYIERLSLILADKNIYVANLISYSENMTVALQERLVKEIERVIKLIKWQEKEIFYPLNKVATDTLRNVVYISKRVEEAQNNDYGKEPVSNVPLVSTPVLDRENTLEKESIYDDNKLREITREKEVLAIKVKKAREKLSDIISDNKLAKTTIGSSRTRKFTEEDIEDIKKLIGELSTESNIK